MEKPRGKAIALCSIGLGLFVLLLAGFVLKDRVLEEYYLHKMEGSRGKEKEAVLQKLGRIGSARALKALLDSLKSASPDFVAISTRTGKAFMFFSGFSSNLDTKGIVPAKGSSIKIWDVSQGYSPSFRSLDCVRYSGRIIYTSINPSCFHALKGITGRLGASAVPHLIGVLESEDFAPRWIPVALLEELGTEAFEAIPVLEKQLSLATEESLRVLLKEILTKIRGDPRDLSS